MTSSGVPTCMSSAMISAGTECPGRQNRQRRDDQRPGEADIGQAQRFLAVVRDEQGSGRHDAGLPPARQRGKIGVDDRMLEVRERRVRGVFRLRGCVRDSISPSPASPARLPQGLKRSPARSDRRDAARRDRDVSAAEPLGRRARREQAPYGGRKCPPDPRCRARSRRKPTACRRSRAQARGRRRDEIEHRRILSDPDRLFERQGHDARAEANSRRACRDMSEKHEWRGKSALIAIKMMLSNPG